MDKIMAFATSLLNTVSFEDAPKATVQEAAWDAVIGFIVVFIGIALLIAVVWLVGKIIGRSQSDAVKSVQEVSVPIAKNTATQDSDEIDEETIAVITAAIMAYYEQQGNKCEFIVKRIKRIKRY